MKVPSGLGRTLASYFTNALFTTQHTSAASKSTAQQGSELGQAEDDDSWEVLSPSPSPPHLPHLPRDTQHLALSKDLIPILDAASQGEETSSSGAVVSVSLTQPSDDELSAAIQTAQLLLGAPSSREYGVPESSGDEAYAIMTYAEEALQSAGTWDGYSIAQGPENLLQDVLQQSRKDLSNLVKDMWGPIMNNKHTQAILHRHALSLSLPKHHSGWLPNRIPLTTDNHEERIVVVEVETTDWPRGHVTEDHDSGGAVADSNTALRTDEHLSASAWMRLAQAISAVVMAIIMLVLKRRFVDSRS